MIWGGWICILSAVPPAVTEAGAIRAFGRRASPFTDDAGALP